MRDNVSSANLVALDAKAFKARSLVWVTGALFSDGSPVSIGFWNEFGNRTLSVIDIETGLPVDRNYIGAAALLSLDDIPLTNDITVRQFNIKLSQIDDAVADQVRLANVKSGVLEVHRLMYNPTTGAVLDAAYPRFSGFIDKCVITDPAEGQEEGGVEITAVSFTRELTRTSGDVRSDPSQQVRSPGDSFYRYTATAGFWTIWWGQHVGRAV
jgi:hypothetical protein